MGQSFSSGTRTGIDPQPMTNEDIARMHARLDAIEAAIERMRRDRYDTAYPPGHGERIGGLEGLKTTHDTQQNNDAMTEAGEQYRLPDGTGTTSRHRSRVEWMRLSRACCRAFGKGWIPYSHGPDVTIMRTDYVLVRIPTTAALDLARTQKRKVVKGGQK